MKRKALAKSVVKCAYDKGIKELDKVRTPKVEKAVKPAGMNARTTKIFKLSSGIPC